MTVREYASGDAGALTLTGTNGSLASLLVAYLVDGHAGYPAAGWTMPFEFSTTKVIRSGAGSNQRYLQLADNLVGLGGLCKAVGYDTMTAYDSGSNPFPSAVQVADGLRIWKSATHDSTVRLWRLVATEKMLYLFVGPQSDLDGANWTLFAFGDFLSFMTGSTHNTLIMGREHATGITTSNEVANSVVAINAASGGHYAVRSYTGLGSAVALGKNVHSALSGMAYPNPTDGGLYLTPLYVHEPTGSVLRGQLPGLYWIPHTTFSLTHGDTFDGSGTLSGKTFRYLRAFNIRLAVEISNTW